MDTAVNFSTERAMTGPKVESVQRTPAPQALETATDQPRTFSSSQGGEEEAAAVLDISGEAVAQAKAANRTIAAAASLGVSAGDASLAVAQSRITGAAISSDTEGNPGEAATVAIGPEATRLAKFVADREALTAPEAGTGPVVSTGSEQVDRRLEATTGENVTSPETPNRTETGHSQDNLGVVQDAGQSPA